MARWTVDRATLVPGIAMTLRNHIWHGQLRPGEHLKLQIWAANLGVSFIPLREALRILEAEGLIEILPHRGVRILPISPLELMELSLEFKGIFLVLLPIAVPLMTRPTIDHLRILAGQLDQERANPEDHLAFWRLVFDPCGLPRLSRQMDQMLWRLGRFFQAGGKAIFNEYKDVHPNREDFLDACEAGDVEGAIQALMAFMAKRVQVFLDRLGQKGKGRSAPG